MVTSGRIGQLSAAIESPREALITSLDQLVSHREDDPALSDPGKDPISPQASDPKTQDRI